MNKNEVNTEEWQNLFDKNIPAQIKKIETKGKLKKEGVLKIPQVVCL